MDLKYSYKPLQLGEIRLLQIRSLTGPPIRHDASIEPRGIHCTLHHVSLEEAVKFQYSALSYTWGDQNHRRDIFIEDDSGQSSTGSHPRCLKVSSNLEAALRTFQKHLKDPWSLSDVKLKSRLFWIDAVCINQADTQERSQQILLMRKIYQRATRLLIWLGDEDENSRVAMPMISAIAKRKILDPNGFRVLLETYTSSNFFHTAWPKIVQLASRPWPSRTWIMQEYASAYSGSTLIYCGNEVITSVEWDTFLRIWDGGDASLDIFKLSVTKNFYRLLGLKENGDCSDRSGYSLLREEVKEKLHQAWLDSMGNW